VKEATREPSCFEGSLDPNHTLSWVQILEDYFGAKAYSNKESFNIANEKL